MTANDPHSENTLTIQWTEKYRSLSGRLSYRSLDDPRTQFDTILVTQDMRQTGFSTRRGHPEWCATSRGRPVWVGCLFRWQGGDEMKIYGLTDVDDKSRRCVSYSEELDISSEEYECHVFVLSAAKLIFTKSVIDGSGFLCGEGPTACSDSSEATGTANRKGVGKVKYLQVRSLRIQQTRTDGQGKSEHGRHRNQAFGRGAVEAADWDAASARTRKRVERMVDGRSEKDVSRRWRVSCSVIVVSLGMEAGTAARA